MTQEDDAECLRRALGRQLAAWRDAAHKTQRSLADQLPFSRSTVANVETGRQQAPREFWQRCDELLGARGDLLAVYDRLAVAKNGMQAVRLAINGEARALGKLRDRRGTAEAVTRAYRLLERFPAATGMTPCISCGIYSEARTASNAATAYLAIADTKRVLAYTKYATRIVDASPSKWSRALVRLDTATALVKGAKPEPEGASLLNEADTWLASTRMGR